MLDMTHVEYIKNLYENEGLSLREIAKRTKHDFKTVQKYAYCDDWTQSEQPPKKTEYPVLGEYIPIIEEWRAQDKKEPRKQRHTVRRIFNRLKKEHGYKGSYDSVKRYVANKKDAESHLSEGFLPIAHPAGEAQIDFGDFKYYDGMGIGKEGHALIVSFPYSNAGWMQVFQAENQECLLTGLKRILNHIGGSFTRGRFDNMTTAVAQVLQGSERVLSEGFRRFALHYRFKSDFCNPGKGNEKGSVEKKVGYTRKNMLVPVPTITDFDEYNKGLLRLCDEDMDREHYKHGKLIKELWQEEAKRLLSLPPHEYDVFRYESVRADKCGFITIDTVKYGLPPYMCEKILQAKIYFDKICVYHDRSLIKTFIRSYDKHDEVMGWKDYLSSLTRKPGAVPHTRFFNQMPKLWQEHLKQADNRERKSALSLLMEIVGDGNESLCDEALQLAEENGRTDTDSIRQCYYLISKTENYPRPLTFKSSPPIINYTPDLTVYDKLSARRKGGGA
jgi:transposase